MGVYYCVDTVLSFLEKQDDLTSESAKNLLVPVRTKTHRCHGYAEDCFALYSQPKIMDLNDEHAEHHLSVLIKEEALYRENLLAVMDEAISERLNNNLVLTALNKAFGKTPLPEASKPETDKPDLDRANKNILHPDLARYDNQKLCELYISFLKYLRHDKKPYDFETRILGKNKEPFLKHYDGYVFGNTGEVKAKILLGFGVRVDHEANKPPELYLEDGRKRAREKDLQEAHEILWAWIEADQYQKRRCQDLDRLFKVQQFLPRLPNWVRLDILKILEKESEKQYYAQILFQEENGHEFTRNMPETAQALLENRDGRINKNIQKLTEDILDKPTPEEYCPAPGLFCEEALKREQEAKHAHIF